MLPDLLKSSWRSEAELVKVLVANLIAEGYRVRTEVPNMGQSADVVATRNRWITAIEVKVQNWRRALHQCRAHELVADYICVAIGTVSVSRELKEATINNGYGVIHCPPESLECRWIVRPVLNRAIWSPQRALLSRAMRVIPHEGDTA